MIDIEVEDTAIAALRFANGALGSIEASTSIYPGYLKRIEIHGTEGTAVLEEEDLTVWDFARKDRRDAATPLSRFRNSACARPRIAPSSASTIRTG